MHAQTLPQTDRESSIFSLTFCIELIPLGLQSPEVLTLVIHNQLEFFNLGQIILTESTACLPLFQFHLKTSVIVKQLRKLLRDKAKVFSGHFTI